MSACIRWARKAIVRIVPTHNDRGNTSQSPKLSWSNQSTTLSVRWYFLLWQASNIEKNENRSFWAARYGWHYLSSRSWLHIITYRENVQRKSSTIDGHFACDTPSILWLKDTGIVPSLPRSAQDLRHWASVLWKIPRRKSRKELVNDPNTRNCQALIRMRIWDSISQ